MDLEGTEIPASVSKITTIQIVNRLLRIMCTCYNSKVILGKREYWNIATSLRSMRILLSISATLNRDNSHCTVMLAIFNHTCNQ